MTPARFRALASASVTLAPVAVTPPWKSFEALLSTMSPPADSVVEPGTVTEPFCVMPPVAVASRLPVALRFWSTRLPAVALRAMSLPLTRASRATVPPVSDTSSPAFTAPDTVSAVPAVAVTSPVAVTPARFRALASTKVTFVPVAVTAPPKSLEALLRLMAPPAERVVVPVTLTAPVCSMPPAGAARARLPAVRLPDPATEPPELLSVSVPEPLNVVAALTATLPAAVIDVLVPSAAAIVVALETVKLPSTENVPAESVTGVFTFTEPLVYVPSWMLTVYGPEPEPPTTSMPRWMPAVSVVT